MHLMSIVFNPEFCLTKLRYLGFEVRIIPLHFALGIDLLLATRYVKVINKKVCGTNGSAVAGTSVLSPNLFTIPHPPHMTVNQGSDVNTNSASISISSDNNSAIHHGRA
uniref:Uncharacterized protein n=1 Tax=Glossina palpalis gambiensis TaxID=67801 RepID=A0A1B0C5G9_9MUSC